MSFGSPKWIVSANDVLYIHNPFAYTRGFRIGILDEEHSPPDPEGRLG